MDRARRDIVSSVSHIDGSRIGDEEERTVNLRTHARNTHLTIVTPYTHTNRRHHHARQHSLSFRELHRRLPGFPGETA